MLSDTKALSSNSWLRKKNGSKTQASRTEAIIYPHPSQLLNVLFSRKLLRPLWLLLLNEKEYKYMM